MHFVLCIDRLDHDTPTARVAEALRTVAALFDDAGTISRQHCEADDEGYDDYVSWGVIPGDMATVE
jgi:hypothetical protein